jgi:signal transduction histidine kinase
MLLELRSEASHRGVQVKVEGLLPDAILRLDPPRLSRVFTNLYQNAFDSVSGRDGALLTVRFSTDDTWVNTEIADNGVGVPADHLRHIFEPFFTHGKDHGTGLGLAICERIIREHGGRIEAESEPGQGAVFRVRLPENPGRLGVL